VLANLRNNENESLLRATLLIVFLINNHDESTMALTIAFNHVREKWAECIVHNSSNGDGIINWEKYFL